jgi:hypothetical protein
VSSCTICALTYFARTAKCISSLFKTESQVINVSASDGSNSAPEFDVSLFLDQEEAVLNAGEADLLSQRPRRNTSASTSFAESATRTFEAWAFESRKICLRQIMKCICSSQIARDPKQILESIHAEHGTYVLQIVQVVMVKFFDKVLGFEFSEISLDCHSSF